MVFRVPTLGNNNLALDFDEDLSSLGVNNFDYVRMVRCLGRLCAHSWKHTDILRSTSHFHPANEFHKGSLLNLFFDRRLSCDTDLIDVGPISTAL